MRREMTTGQTLLLPERVRRVPTMLTEGERKLLYALSRFDFEGVGRIVDAGPFIGGSTVALAQGLRDAGWSGSRIDVYDRFKVEGYTVSWFEGLRRGRSFRTVFDEHLRGYEDLLRVHEGSITQASFDDPIELLSLDVLKSWAINDDVVKRAFSRLLPGAIIVQQDHGSGLLPWIAVTMEHLADEVEPLFEVGSSVVYRVVAPIPAEKLSPLRQRLSTRELLALMDRAVARSTTRTAWLLVAKAQMTLRLVGRHDGLRALRDVEDRCRDQPEVLEVARQLRRFDGGWLSASYLAAERRRHRRRS